MENQLEIIKSNLPYGYEKKIALEVGCSVGTVHNILNDKPAAARSTYKVEVLRIAERMANEKFQAIEQLNQTAINLDNLTGQLNQAEVSPNNLINHGTTS